MCFVVMNFVAKNLKISSSLCVHCSCIAPAPKWRKNSFSHMLHGDKIFQSWLPGFLGGEFVISPAEMLQKLILACYVVMNVLAWIPKFLRDRISSILLPECHGNALSRMVCCDEPCRG